MIMTDARKGIKFQADKSKKFPVPLLVLIIKANHNADPFPMTHVIPDPILFWTMKGWIWT